MGRVIPLEEFKDDAEYEEGKKKLNYYGGLYAWLENDKAPFDTIYNEIQELMNELSNDDGMQDEEKKKIEKQIQALAVRSEKIKKRNI